MAGVSISNPVAQKMEGVEFVGACNGAKQRFRVQREDLEDLDYNTFDSAEGLMQAFERHKGHIAEVAERTFKQGDRPAVVVLRSLLG
jgi:hypothetical protein